MRRAYLGLLIAFIVFAAGCIFGGSSQTGTPSTTTSSSLPFTAEELKNAITGLKSYEYAVRVDSYNGTKLAAQLFTNGSVDFERKLKSVLTFSNTTSGGGAYYRSYYYTTARGYAAYFDRNGTVSWEASCYGPGQGPGFNSTSLDWLSDIISVDGVKVVEKDEYYIVYANETGGTAGNNQITAYKTEVVVKLTKELIPVEVNTTVHYKRDGFDWVDVTRMVISRPNAAKVEPPEELVSYLEKQGISLEEFLKGC
ncbi:hypothetical protein [Thermococcus pacificus]|uniref:Uncharacterized protein n=1 Tax=Thermococcus pacificus TaxID=71998 RepID=A0A218P7F6_9EURY|nr:hypothetical protein [Thermococcus pacificus]ASJ06716.1 hypothetical protein A3L08_04980 [Thermococcus pacificus]